MKAQTTIIAKLLLGASISLTACSANESTDNSTTIIQCNLDSQLVATTVTPEQLSTLPAESIQTITPNTSGQTVTYTIEFCENIGNETTTETNTETNTDNSETSKKDGLF